MKLTNIKTLATVAGLALTAGAALRARQTNYTN